MTSTPIAILVTPSFENASVSTTQSGLVYESLRSDVLHGVLEPGSKLRVEAICARYGVGASPLREALSRLSAEGLVERSEQRGFSVSALKWDELLSLNRTRLLIESVALRESIENRTREWEEKLALLLHRISRLPRSTATESFESNRQWESLHSEFHRCLLSQCPSRWICDFCAELRDEFYRFRVVAAGQSYGQRDPQAEHLAIFHASIDGRADEAIALLAEHYALTSELVSQHAAIRTPTN